MAASVAALTAPCTCGLGASVSSLSPIRSIPPRRRDFHGPSLKLSRIPESMRFAPLTVRATTSSEETTTEDMSKQVEEIFGDLKGKWDSIENKSNVLIYGGGALVTLWLSTTIVGAINSVPLLPKVMELVGLGYTGWFGLSVPAFQGDNYIQNSLDDSLSSRKELLEDVEELKKKITGATE